MARLKVKYTEEIAPALMNKFQYKSVMQIPKLSKVIVNVGCGESKGNAKEIEAICKDIATIGVVLAANGIHPVTGERVIRKENARIVKTIMTTCGMYDASGEFAVSCGVPAKSGVGGGILGAVPGRYGIGTFGPALDAKGNSIAGIRMMEYLSRKLELSIFQIG